MTGQENKESPKGTIPRIGPDPSAAESFLAWLKRYATQLGIAVALAGVMVTVGILLWAMTSARFDDAAVRIGDSRADLQAMEGRLTTQIGEAKAEARSAESRLTAQIGEAKAEARAAESRLGKRIDDLQTEIREARQERKADMNALRLDIQGLRQDRPANDAD